MPNLAGIPGLSGASGFFGSFGNMFSFVWQLAKWLGIFAVVGIAIYYFILRPLRYKDFIEVRDLTKGGIIARSDKGYWKESRRTGEGYYTLLKDKRARLMHPPQEHAILTTRGKKKYTLVKFGTSPFDYASISQDATDDVKQMTQTPLADEEWVKHETKLAAEKKVLSGFWNDPAKVAPIVMIVTMVIIMIILISFFKAIPDTANAVASQISSKGSEYVGAMERITQEMHNIADQLSGKTYTASTPPPPI